MTISECPRCGAEFEQTPGKGRSRKYCSPDCHHEEFTCESCGARGRGYPGKRFCSVKCRVDVMTRSNSDVEVQRSRGRRGGRVRGEQLRKRTLEEIQADKDRIKVPRVLSSNSYVKENGEHLHRIVAAKTLGRPLLPGEVVHHEDRNKHNNAPENLIVFSGQDQHARHHKLGHENYDPCECQGIRLRDLT